MSERVQPDPDKLYWVTIHSTGSRHLVRTELINDGAGVEFYDATTGDYVGFAGINRWQEETVEHVPPRYTHRDRASGLAADSEG